MDRRRFLAGGLAGAGAFLLSPGFLRSALAATTAGDGPYGAPTVPHDHAGMLLPPGFEVRQLARGGQVVQGTSYPWHWASDGQAAYRTLDGGWIVVSNSEAPAALRGGSSALRFSPEGEVVDAYGILGGTNLNCAGGPTPWGTWLSCEEHEGGMVWEADPAGRLAPVPRPALGNFAHEAAAVDRARGHVYLTEDQPDGLFYRFTPDEDGDLSSGVLEAAIVEGGSVRWERVPDPNLVTEGRRTREQVPGAGRFAGAEGLWHHEGVVYFTTKGDRKVWAYTIEGSRLEVLHDHDATPGSALSAVDNLTVSPYGDVYVCEDGGDPVDICLITPDADPVVAPFVRLVGAEHEGSELAGVVFDPSGRRMYFASQRAYPYVGGTPLADGAVYEVTGPFRLPAGGVPESWVFGPPAGERDGSGLGGPLGLSAKAGPVRVRVRLRLRREATVDLVVRTSALRTERWHGGGDDRPVAVTLATARQRLAAGEHSVDLAVPASAPLDAVVTAAIRTDGSHTADAVAVALGR